MITYRILFSILIATFHLASIYRKQRDLINRVHEMFFLGQISVHGVHRTLNQKTSKKSLKTCKQKFVFENTRFFPNCTSNKEMWTTSNRMGLFSSQSSFRPG